MNKTCDLILLTWNHLEVTKRCLRSLFEQTDLPSRLVIVDNGSDQPGAKEYLQSVQPAGNVQEVVFIRNEEDLGFSRGMNTGLRFCLGRQPAPCLCLVSNDVIVTKNWLSELAGIAESDPAIGLVNPSSTNFGFYPPSMEKINEYGVRITRSLKGKWQELGSCIGFCFLAKREVFEKIGLLDETFGMAYYEDADFSKRTQAAGYLCVLAEGSYVYHEQGKSFGKQQEKSPLFLKNEEIFYFRWKMNKPGRIGYILFGNNHSDPQEFSRRIRELANQFNKIWILCQRGELGKILPNHWNVQKIFFSGPSFLFNLWSLSYLLVKKKKFNAVFVDDPRLLAFLKRFQWKYQGELRLLSMNNEQ